ncbi:MAG: hypothetical protein HY815_24210 [Candidatus Riflebacteria bacterium]|nr:hypothetical protein [Candidatus Riflebacteria bacterium]
MAEKLTWDEITSRCPDQYVSRTKQALAGKSAAVLFTGEGDEGTFLL